jgi:mycofactocin precursor
LLTAAASVPQADALAADPCGDTRQPRHPEREANVEQADKVETLEIESHETKTQEPEILEDICVEELAIDGICGVY